MRPEVVVPPHEDSSLASLPIHVLARDFPEALQVFREEEVDLRALGARPLKEAEGEVVRTLSRKLEWRREM